MSSSNFNEWREMLDYVYRERKYILLVTDDDLKEFLEIYEDYPAPPYINVIHNNMKSTKSVRFYDPTDLWEAIQAFNEYKYLKEHPK